VQTTFKKKIIKKKKKKKKKKKILDPLPTLYNVQTARGTRIIRYVISCRSLLRHSPHLFPCLMIILMSKVGKYESKEKKTKHDTDRPMKSP
jgi:hypothetical protein